MAQFVTGQTLETAESEIEVTVNPQNPLPVGRHRFQLVVVDDSGNVSAPDVVEVIVKGYGEADRRSPSSKGSQFWPELSTLRKALFGRWRRSNRKLPMDNVTTALKGMGKSKFKTRNLFFTCGRGQSLVAQIIEPRAVIP